VCLPGTDREREGGRERPRGEGERERKRERDRERELQFTLTCLLGLTCYRALHAYLGVQNDISWITKSVLHFLKTSRFEVPYRTRIPLIRLVCVRKGKGDLQFWGALGRQVEMLEL
jgi:hypothetical protein